MGILNMVYGSGGGEESKEYIEIIMKADSSGNLKIPVGGYILKNGSLSQNAPYDWKVSYDGGAEVTTSGNGSITPITIATGLTAGSSHTIKIKPTTESYGWARAFGFQNTGIGDLLLEIIYDGSYMGYATSATNTGDFFRYYQYGGCTNIVYLPKESLPDTVTSIGNYFMKDQYYGCTGLIGTAIEEIPNTVTSIGEGFRDAQYYGCSNLRIAYNESISSNITSIGIYFRRQQYDSCRQLVSIPEEAFPTSLTTIPNHFRNSQYSGCESLAKTVVEILPDTVTSIGSNYRYRQYRYCKSINEILGLKDLNIGGNAYRTGQFQSCTSNKTIKVLSDVGYTWGSNALDNAYITQVQVPSAYLSNFTGATIYPRSSITDSKFVGY